MFYGTTLSQLETSRSDLVSIFPQSFIRPRSVCCPRTLSSFHQSRWRLSYHGFKLSRLGLEAARLETVKCLTKLTFLWCSRRVKSEDVLIKSYCSDNYSGQIFWHSSLHSLHSLSAGQQLTNEEYESLQDCHLCCQLCCSTANNRYSTLIVSALFHCLLSTTLSMKYDQTKIEI